MRKKVISLMALALFNISVATARDITVHASSMPAEKVFSDIMKQSGKNFVYTAGLLKDIKVTVNADNRPLKEVLDNMFSGTDISYKIKGNNIMLFRNKRQEKPKAKRVTVNGFVRDADSGEALAGAFVKSESDGAATMANSQGYYSLSIPEGKTGITATYTGYDRYNSGNLDISANRTLDIPMNVNSQTLKEVEVLGSRNNSLAMESPSVGVTNVSSKLIASTPVIFGESDVIKTLQLEPGVSAGVEATAGMYVHGGNVDENLYMLDNIPLYQVNHVAGLFSAFNTEALRNVDFYKSSFPAKYDGRLSSFMDVHTKDGSMEEHHGSVRLGLTSGAFNIDGPIWKGHTSYSVALRRSWLDVLTIPATAIYSAFSTDEKYSTGLAFTDLNAKINHRFSNRSSLYLMAYYGEDYLRVKQSFGKYQDEGDYDETVNNLRWGNLVASLGWNYVISHNLFMEATAAFSRYQSRLTHSYEEGYKTEGTVEEFSKSATTFDNHINDWIFKTDFEWHPHGAHNVGFGASYTYHSFIPSRDKRTIESESVKAELIGKFERYKANEFNIFAGDDWTISDRFRINYGAHFSLFNIEKKTHSSLSPRLAVRFTPADNWAVKAAYSRTTQYVHQLIQSSISLPTDQWVPIIGNQKPQTADKIAAGVYYSLDGKYTFSVEGYWKWMRNLIEYRDEYYLIPPGSAWHDKLVMGKGTSKGIDFKISKNFGNITGHISYSLLWADRQFPDKNNGKKFPARFDNRHKINVMADWKINDKWELSATWTGMSGNRITLVTQSWEDPLLAPWHYGMNMRPTSVNNYRLPFYHRMDFSAKRNTKKGFWTFSVYNLYCNMNTITIVRDYSDEWIQTPTGAVSKPVFKKLKAIPIIPSVSYTWLF